MKLSVICEYLARQTSSRVRTTIVARVRHAEVLPIVLKVGGAILTQELEELSLSLSFLNRVGLYPVVIHGMGRA